MQLPEYYAPAKDLLAGRRILITGAGDGLGRAASRACAAHGATVVLLGRTVAKLEATYDAIKAAGGPEPAIYPMNLAGATWNDLADLGATLEREFGVLHGLLHCAVHFRGFSPLADLDPRDWMESLQVNLTAPFALTRFCLPLLMKAEDASVVFVSDAVGRRAHAYHGAYGVAKFGLEGLMQTWAEECANRGTPRFSSFDPGPLRTQLRRTGYPAESLEDLPPPESTCPALLYLLGPDSRGVNGRAF